MPKAGSSTSHISFSLSTIISAKSNETEDKCCSMYFPGLCTTLQMKEKSLEAHVQLHHAVTSALALLCYQLYNIIKQR